MSDTVAAAGGCEAIRDDLAMADEASDWAPLHHAARSSTERGAAAVMLYLLAEDAARNDDDNKSFVRCRCCIACFVRGAQGRTARAGGQGADAPPDLASLLIQCCRSSDTVPVPVL